MTLIVASDPQFVEVGGVYLEVKRWPGGGLPILMLHEGLGSVSMWRDFPDLLAAATGREVIAWSRRGYGRSSSLPQRRDPDYMNWEAAIIPALLNRLEVPRAHFFGHSDGGTIALLAAALSPERVATLILEAPHVLVEQITYDSIAAVKRDLAPSNLLLKLARYHDRVEEVFWRWNDIWLDPRFRSWNIEGVLPAISAPTLLIQGHDDQYGTFDQLDRIEAVVPDTKRIELAACGHSPHRDQPQAVLDATRQFLEGRD